MKIIASPSETKKILDKFGFSFQKKYGQNFLIDENIVRKIVSLSGVGPDDIVLEVGPGIGTMTQILSEYAKTIVAVEIDKKLLPVLEYTLSDCPNVEVINCDILKCNLKDIKNKYSPDRPLKVVANLPYYITSPIIMAILETNSEMSYSIVDSMTVMLQKEVAERISALPGGKDYGVLSLATQYYCDVKMLMKVSASCFMPRPNVESAVIRMDISEKNKLSADIEKEMFTLIKAAFSQRRKTFINSVSAMTSYDKNKIIQALKRLGLNENIRGEMLTLKEFTDLTYFLKEK